MVRTGLWCIGMVVFVVAAMSDFAAAREEGEEGIHASPDRQLAMEHQITEKIAGAAREQAAAVRGGRVDREAIGRIVDFFVNFTDRCHHAKEERYYFPAVLNSAPQAAPAVDELIMDHDEGKRHLIGVRGLLAQESLDTWGRFELAWRLDEYAHLIVGHIEREDRLFAVAEPVFSDAQRERLIAGFMQIETGELGANFHQRYHDLAMQILDRAQEHTEP